MTNIRRNGPSAAAYTHPNRQIYSGGHNHQQGATKAHKSHGHVIPLAARQGSQSKQFRFFWRTGLQNFADYRTKHHPHAHHRNTRNEFLTPLKALMDPRDTGVHTYIGYSRATSVISENSKL